MLGGINAINIFAARLFVPAAPNACIGVFIFCFFAELLLNKLGIVNFAQSSPSRSYADLSIDRVLYKLSAVCCVSILII